MGAATRESERSAIAALDELQALDPATGDELLAAARAIASSTQLTVVLSDPGIEATAKSSLVGRVFGGYGAETQALLQELASGRWSADRDLVDTIEVIAYRALARSAAEPLETELFTVQRAVAGEPELELGLSNQAVPLGVRLELVDRLLEHGGTSTRAIVRHVVALPRGRRVLEGLGRAAQIVAAASGGLVAVAEVAVPLGELQRERLAAALAKKYGRAVAVNQVIDRTIVGGVRVRIGDEVIDGTVRARLADLQQRLAG